MTREEAIAILNRDDADMRKGLFCINDFLAIEVLKQEPCEDCISRQAVLDKIYDVDGMEALENSNIFAKHYANMVKSIPSVTPKEKTGKWIQQPRCEGDEQPDLVCPNCGFKISWWDMGNFCAKCGKGLEGGAE